jgi:hypothetical protein
MRGHELLCIIVDQALLMQQSKLTDRTLCESWPEAFVDQVNKLISGWRPSVEFKMMIP